MQNNQYDSPWSEIELAWMMKNYSKATTSEALNALPRRARTAIKKKACKFGLKKTNRAMSNILSEINKGRIRTEENKLKISKTLTGKVQSEDTKLKRSKSMKQFNRFGKNNPNWKDEVSEDQSRYRARHILPPGKCTKCDRKGTDVHHKDENPFNNEPENLERLCAKHHRQEHARLKKEKINNVKEAI